MIAAGTSNRARNGAIFAAILVVALAARLQPWSKVFPPGVPGAVFVGDTDTYYHALRAERIASDYPVVPWIDPGMNFPLGADILWPPLFDFTIASLAVAVADGPPSRATIERVAAMLPPLFGVMTVGVAMGLAMLLFRDGSWPWAGLLLALLPIHVEFSTVGRPDQHALESLLQCGVVLAYVLAWRSRRAVVLALGVLLAAAFWNWQGSALYLGLLAAFVAASHLGAVRESRSAAQTLAYGSGIAAVLLVMSIAAWGRPGALRATALSGINGIQAMLCALTALSALALYFAGRARTGESGVSRRVLEVALAAVVPAVAATLLIPGMRDGIRQGWLALAAGNPWYESIREFQPPLFGGTGIRRELAAWVPRFAPLFVLPVATFGLWTSWRRRVDRRPEILFVVVWAGLLTIATLARLRFALYLAVPAVLVGAAGLRALLPQARRLWAAVALLLVPAGFYFAHGGLWPDPEHREVAAALEWLRNRERPDDERPAVFSEWDWGHLVQYSAGRPTVATPFGSDGGAGAIEDAARFFLSTSPTEVAEILERRRAGYLLLVDPVTHAAEFAGYAPPTAPPPVHIEWHPVSGPRMSVRPEVDDLVAVRVYFDSGLSSRGLPSLTTYRLVYEGAPGPGRQPRIFEIVPGAELAVSGAPPGEVVRARLRLRTAREREADWYVESRADPGGRAFLRVPFSTGSNGEVSAGPVRVACSGRDLEVAVPSDAVEDGARIEVPCGSGS